MRPAAGPSVRGASAHRECQTKASYHLVLSCLGWQAISLDLGYGPYVVDFSRNGRHILLGGRKGELSLLDCHALKPLCEINVGLSVSAVSLICPSQRPWTVLFPMCAPHPMR